MVDVNIYTKKALFEKLEEEGRFNPSVLEALSENYDKFEKAGIDNQEIWRTCERALRTRPRTNTDEHYAHVVELINAAAENPGAVKRLIPLDTLIEAKSADVVREVIKRSDKLITRNKGAESFYADYWHQHAREYERWRDDEQPGYVLNPIQVVDIALKGTNPKVVAATLDNVSAFRDGINDHLEAGKKLAVKIALGAKSDKAVTETAKSIEAIVDSGIPTPHDAVEAIAIKSNDVKQVKEIVGQLKDLTKAKAATLKAQQAEQAANTKVEKALKGLQSKEPQAASAIGAGKAAVRGRP